MLEAAGATTTAAIAAASLVGACQVGGRLLDALWLRRLHPFATAKIANTLHPLGALLLMTFGAPLAAVFTALHGAGMGLMTIVKGTLPLALFGPAGFGRRAGFLEGPSRVMQAAAPVVFGLLLEALGGAVVWITAALSVAAFIGLWWVERLVRPQSPVAIPVSGIPATAVPELASVPDPNQP